VHIPETFLISFRVKMEGICIRIHCSNINVGDLEDFSKTFRGSLHNEGFKVGFFVEKRDSF
jgi:hypothetical protein